MIWLSRIIMSRLEIAALVNSCLVAATSFGMSVSEPQQLAIIGVVNGFMVVGYRLMTGRPVEPSS